ncbi:DUF6600 domain-containing protein [Flavobacterium sp.]|uniref:DUF6600 domain-containing protein n=1 Tax=Flavobacterium sp. TaxID=239 RepID=UPI00260CFA91|nr:DUF6600 domain-containing protein [Flavobacterium sp.]
MKTIRKVTILLIFFIGIIGVAPQKATAQVSVSFQLFYDNLSPYGNWIDNSDYGYVWVPNVSRGFTPYGTNGYWVYADVGWTWVSNYSWGWAPFHYGRWFYDSYYGWVWVPDTNWGPAWVTWRYYDGYYGWAAIGPGISLSLAYSSGYNVPRDHWVFVREGDFGRRNISNYYVNTTNNITIINNSTVINNLRTDRVTQGQYNAGPDRNDVKRRSKADFAQVNLKERNNPGQSMSGNELQLYRPRVEKGGNDGRRPAPAKVMKQNEVKPINERRSVAQPQREIKREREPQMNPPSRQPENRGRDIQQQRNEEMKKQREGQRANEQRANEQRANEQKIQQRANEQRAIEQRANEQKILRRENEPVQRQNVPVPEQRDLKTPPRQEKPIQQDNIPQMRRPEIPQQQGNNERMRTVKERPERGRNKRN